MRGKRLAHLEMAKMEKSNERRHLSHSEMAKMEKSNEGKRLSHLEMAKMKKLNEGKYLCVGIIRLVHDTRKSLVYTKEYQTEINPKSKWISHIVTMMYITYQFY